MCLARTLPEICKKCISISYIPIKNGLFVLDVFLLLRRCIQPLFICSRVCLKRDLHHFFVLPYVRLAPKPGPAKANVKTTYSLLQMRKGYKTYFEAQTPNAKRYYIVTNKPKKYLQYVYIHVTYMYIDRCIFQSPEGNAIISWHNNFTSLRYGNRDIDAKINILWR